MNLFIFYIQDQKVMIEADNKEQARAIFQQRYGFLPKKEG